MAHTKNAISYPACEAEVPRKAAEARAGLCETQSRALSWPMGLEGCPGTARVYTAAAAVCRKLCLVPHVDHALTTAYLTGQAVLQLFGILKISKKNETKTNYIVISIYHRLPEL